MAGEPKAEGEADQAGAPVEVVVSPNVQFLYADSFSVRMTADGLDIGVYRSMLRIEAFETRQTELGPQVTGRMREVPTRVHEAQIRAPPIEAAQLALLILRRVAKVEGGAELLATMGLTLTPKPDPEPAPSDAGSW